MSLAAILIPMIPGMVQAILSIVNAIRDHAETPEAAKAQLDGISLQLAALKERVAAVTV